MIYLIDLSRKKRKYTYKTRKMTNKHFNNDIQKKLNYNVYLFNERKRFQTGKGKKQKIPRTNNYGRRLRQWHNAFGKYTCLSRNLAT